MPELEPLMVDIAIDAPPAAVWELVGDPRHLPEWSPQVLETSLLDGANGITVGVRFRSHNREGQLEWSTHGRVTRLEPGRVLAFEIEENWLVWSFTLQETANGGTRLVQRREAPRGISEFAHGLTEKHMGGTAAFNRHMEEGMRQTLQGIRAQSEQALPRTRNDARSNVSDSESPALSTHRLRLSVPRRGDAAAILAIAGDRRAVEHNPSDMIHDQGEADELLDRWIREWQERGHGYWCIRETDSDQAVGYCGVKHMLADRQPVLNLIYRLTPEVWGRGYATEATRAAVSWASDHLPDRTILARVRPNNSASHRVALKAGLRRDSAYDGEGKDGLDLAYTNRSPLPDRTS